jgi:hypothetical protein
MCKSGDCGHGDNPPDAELLEELSQSCNSLLRRCQFRPGKGMSFGRGRRVAAHDIRHIQFLRHNGRRPNEWLADDCIGLEILSDLDQIVRGLRDSIGGQRHVQRALESGGVGIGSRRLRPMPAAGRNGTKRHAGRFDRGSNRFLADPEDFAASSSQQRRRLEIAAPIQVAGQRRGGEQETSLHQRDYTQLTFDRRVGQL